MNVIFIIIFVVLFICSVFFRTIVLNPFSTIKYTCLDFYHYFIHRLFNKAPTGNLDAYCAHFGKGKTLSMAHYIYAYSHRFHNKKYYDIVRKCWITQRVCVLANFEYVDKDIVCWHLSTLDDFVEYAQNVKQYDNEHNTRTVLLCCIDEASSVMNSRNFKSNFNPLVVSTLLTSRHYNANFIYSSQKFKLTDALMRSVTQRVIVCNKLWRVMKLSYYDADQVELASDVSLIKPLYKRGWFIKDKHFALYDTLACVDTLSKDTSQLSWTEILDSISPSPTDNDAILKPSAKLKKLRKSKK